MAAPATSCEAATRREKTAVESFMIAVEELK
jgi:hypothetical protein